MIFKKRLNLAERTVAIYGMSDELGLVAFEKMQQQFIEGYAPSRRQISAKEK